MLSLVPSACNTLIDLSRPSQKRVPLVWPHPSIEFSLLLLKVLAAFHYVFPPLGSHCGCLFVGDSVRPSAECWRSGGETRNYFHILSTDTDTEERLIDFLSKQTTLSRSRLYCVFKGQHTFQLIV